MLEVLRTFASMLLFLLAMVCMSGGAPLSALIAGGLGLYFLPPFRRAIGFTPSRGLSIVVSVVGLLALAWTFAAIGDAVKATAGDPAVSPDAPVQP